MKCILDEDQVYLEDRYRRAFELVDSYLDSFLVALNIGRSIKAYEFGVENVLLTGMGGWGIVCDFAAEILRNNGVNAVVSKSYLPPAGRWDLVIAVSYSGNTAEILNSVLKLVKENVVVLTSNGRLERLASKMNFPVIKVRGGIPPRYAFPDMLGGVLGYLESNHGIKLDELSLEELRDFQEMLKRDRKIEENPAKAIAVEIAGSTPIIYVYEEVRLAGYRLKCELNENAKLLCHYAEIPEALHNEIESIPDDAVIMFPRSFREPEEISRSIDALRRVLRDRRFIDLRVRSRKYLEELLEFFMLSDYLSLYSAVLRKTNPMTLERVEELKRANKANLKVLERVDGEIGL